MKKSIIVAIARNNVIGHKNSLPWRMPADLRHFKQTTMGHPVIMGRKTFASMGHKPLSGRMNIVLTRNTSITPPTGCEIANALQEAFQTAEASGAQEAFVIGGSQVYAEAIPMADTLYITEIDGDVEGDTYFPSIDWSPWEAVHREAHAADADNPFPYTFITYKRKAQ